MKQKEFLNLFYVTVGVHLMVENVIKLIGIMTQVYVSVENQLNIIYVNKVMLEILVQMIWDWWVFKNYAYMESLTKDSIIVFDGITGMPEIESINSVNNKAKYKTEY